MEATQVKSPQPALLLHKMPFFAFTSQTQSSNLDEFKQNDYLMLFGAQFDSYKMSQLSAPWLVVD